MASRVSASPHPLAVAVVERYLSLDRRALTLFRVWFGLLLFVDVVRRIPFAAVYYSNEGVLSNHYALFAPLSHKPLSLLFALSTPTEVTIAFVVMAACHLCLAVGYRTRLMQVLAIVFTTSLNQRNPFLENGGCVVLVILALWTVFLPLGDHGSIDALRRRTDAPDLRSPVITLVALGLLVQVAAIYFFNGVQKTGADWASGDVIHYLLWQNRIATPLAGWLRMHEPAWLSPIATRGTLWLEMASPLLLFFPFGWQRLRTLHAAAFIGFHVSIASLCYLGPFSWAMVGLNLLLLPPTAMDVLEQRFARASRAFGDALAAIAARLGPAPTPRPVPTLAREALVALLFSTMLAQLGHDNDWLRGRLPDAWLRGPRLFAALIDYGRVGQGWVMFRDAPRHDGRLVVDAVMRSGRHVDPFTKRAPDFEAAHHGPWNMSQLDCDYHLKISFPDNDRYRAELGRWVAAWRDPAAPSDTVVSYDVYWVSNASPPPGHTVPFAIERHKIASSR